MKILLVSEFFPIKLDGEISGGAESRSYYLAKSLSVRHDVTVITAFIYGSLRRDNWGKLKIIRVGRGYSYVQTGNFINRFIFFIAGIIEAVKTNWDVIDANSVPTYILAWVVGLLRRARTVFWIPDVVGVRQAVRHFGVIVGLLEGVFELISIYFFRADKTIALSETTKNKLLSLGFKDKDIEVIYPGV